MTTEVAVMNRSAISLAADSAVTIGGEKVYNTVNKLFMLSKHHPVGVMIYGNADVNSIPWETLIKVYRKNLNDRCFPTLSEYAQDFISFLEQQQSPISHHHKEGFLFASADNICSALLTDVAEQLKSEPVDHAELKEIAAGRAKALIGNIAQQIRNCCEAKNLPAVESIKARYADHFKSIAASTLELIYSHLDEQTIDTLIDGICHYFYANYMIGDASGIVIAGFGDKELFPQLTTYRVQGFFENTGKYFRDEGLSADEGDIKFQDRVVPFAMDDMIHTFMSGIDPVVNRFLRAHGAQAFPAVIEESWACLEKALGPNIPEDVKTEMLLVADRHYNQMFEELTAFTRENQIQPVTQMLRSLPKDELAEMAETLVSLIAFRKKVTKDTESVGGPIDVAVITKGDGFVWIKRKNYFDPKLNQHFLSNYNKN